MVVLILWGLCFFSILVAFFGGLCPKRIPAIIFQVISWFDVVMFAILLWQNYFSPFYVAEVAVLICLRSTSTVWGIATMSHRYANGLDYEPDIFLAASIFIAFFAGIIAFWGFVGGFGFTLWLKYH